MTSNGLIPASAIPTTQDHALDWLRLIRSDRVGPTTFLRLLNTYGNAGAALAALPDIASRSGAAKYRIADADTARREVRAAKALGARLLFLGTPDYPHQLYDLEDPPPALWALGDIDLLKRPAVALVGARNASAVGKRMTIKLATDLGALGYVVVSGLARGVDACAHTATLETGTIAVQAGGLDVIYPQENADLSLRIAEQGLRLSEMPIGLAPHARHFPRRNRIISGLAQGIVVVEGAARSGSLITARNALDQGRDVMAVPGNPLDPRAAGCNMLIRDGATLVRNAEDIHECLSALATRHQTGAPTAPQVDAPAIGPSPDMASLPEHILALLSPAPVFEDDVIRQVPAPARDVMSALAELDVSGRIERQPGGLVALAVA